MKILKRFTAYVKEGVKGSIVPEAAVYTDKLVCNKCGEVFWDSEKTNGKVSYLRCQKEWEKGSPWGEETHEFDLCTSCYNTLITSFKRPVDKGFFT